MSTVLVKANYSPGYGGSDRHELLVTYDNRALERIERTAAFSQGDIARYRRKWEKRITRPSFSLADYELASPWCSECGLSTLDGRSSCVGKVFCEKCQEKIPLRIAEYEAANAEREKLRLERAERDQADRRSSIHEILAQLFHWRDRWYFGRHSSGSARIVRVSPSHEYLELDIEVPAPEWASIVCAVSIGGEADGRHQQALAFHNGRQQGAQQ